MPMGRIQEETAHRPQGIVPIANEGVFARQEARDGASSNPRA